MTTPILKYVSALQLCLLLQTIASAQNKLTDTTNVTFTIENADSSHYNFRRQYPYVAFAQIHERNLLKAGTSAFKANDHFYIGFEHKLSPSFSCTIDLSNERWQPDLRFGARYYVAMGRKIREGTSGNNTNGLYLASRINIGSVGSQYNANFILADCAIGFQKRLNWFTYMDVSIFVSSVDQSFFENYGYIFGINGKFGLAWGWGNR